MVVYLKQSTASQEVILGRFLDSTDGNTEKTALTIANTDIKVWKNGGTTAGNKNSGGGTHIANGLYYCVLDATDTDTLGPLEVHTHVSTALATKLTCCVLAANVFDSLIGGGDILDVSVTQWTGTNVASPDTAGYPKVTHKVGSGTGELDITSGVVKANLAQILGTALTETSGQIAAAFKKFFDKATPTGTINSIPDAVAGATGGLFIAGTNAATTVTTALTTTFTGNLTGNVGGNVTGSVGSLAAQAKADVNAEVVDTLATDTYAEPGQGSPPATTTIVNKINYLYKMLRNKKTQTSTTFSLYADDATTVDQKATVSDDGTTFTSGEVGTGP